MFGYDTSIYTSRTRWLHDYISLSLQEESETTDIPLQTHTHKHTHPFVSWFITRYKHRKNRRVHTKPPRELSAEQTRTSRTHSSFRAAACRGLTKLSSFFWGGLEGVEFPVQGRCSRNRVLNIHTPSWQRQQQRK